MYSRVCSVYVCTDESVHVCEGQRSTSGIPQNTFFLFLFVDTGSLADLELSN